VKATRLPELTLGSAESDLAVSQHDFAPESGKAYRLSMTSNGAKEMEWL
jgi:hypothetical protein